jgi:hypothetical protein
MSYLLSSSTQICPLGKVGGQGANEEREDVLLPPANIYRTGLIYLSMKFGVAYSVNFCDSEILTHQLYKLPQYALAYSNTRIGIVSFHN